MIFNCETSASFPACMIARTEEGKKSDHESVNRAFDGMGATRQFYKEVFNRNSIDDKGMRLDGYVHYDVNYNNAFWDGQRMVFGDGDGVLFTDFTGSLDVIGHELAHGVTEFSAGLEYHNEPGALNESMSDVMGSLVKQWHNQQSAEEADWLIGPDIFTPGIGADALRSMKAPGTAYNNPDLGKDPQPDHYDKFIHLPDTPQDDFGGVHINSGIPNKAFYLTAMNIGGKAWEKAGFIWYEALKASSPNTQFNDFAVTTYQKAISIFGANTHEDAVLDAWQQVGLLKDGVDSRLRRDGGGRRQEDEDALVALKLQVERMSQKLTEIAQAIGKVDGG